MGSASLRLFACLGAPANNAEIMIKHIVFLCLFILATFSVAHAEVLIVADEFPAMELLAAKLKSEERITSKLVRQNQLPESLAGFEAVIVYIHGALSETAEVPLVEYTRAGGKLILLHHSISSGKRKNRHWFSFLGVALPEGDVSQGGYKWIEGVHMDLVNLSPNHFITTNKLNYPSRIPYASPNTPSRESSLPGFTLEETEVYLNHVHTEPRTLLLGLTYQDAKTGTTYMQDRAGWIKPGGKGWIIYLMAGHSIRDFENPPYSRIVLNAVIFKP